MHHPNVVSVVDSGVFGARPYLVMDYVEGTSLRELMSVRGRALPQRIAISIILDALAGLDATHTATSDEGKPLRVVHGDVSPENLLIGVDGICRLSDFGIARSGAQDPRQRTTRGRPAYLAPEQVLGGPVDQRADIFSLGTVLFEALTGVPLFQAATAEDSLQQVCLRKIPLPSTVGARPSPSIDWICMKALEREPSRRFATAREMLTELRRMAMREELLASMPEVSARVRATVGRELAQRRLFVLERSRQGAAPNDSVDTISVRGSTPAAEKPQPRPAHSEAARRTVSPTPNLDSQPAPADPSSSPGSVGRSLLIAVSVLAVFAVIAACVWPEGAKDLLSRVTSAAGWRTLGSDPADLE